MIRMNDSKVKTTLKAAVLLSVLLLFAAAPAFSQQVVNLTAGPATTTMPDGTVVPMWSYTCQALTVGVTSSATCAPLSGVSVAAGMGALNGIYVVSGGSGYSSSPTVTISAPTGAITGVTNATATATAVVTGGAVVGFNWTNRGAGYIAAPTVTITDATGSGAVAAAGLAWSPVVITVPSGAAGGLQINLTNNLLFAPVGGGTNKIPTSIVIMGQVGGGLGTSPTTTPSPNHSDTQGCPTWFIASGATPPGVPCTAPQAGASGTPPIQAPRVQSMSTEAPAVAPGTTSSTSLTWANLKPGTYLLESGTHPSIQVPMGLIGMLVVTAAPTTTAATATAPATAVAGTAYPAVAATTKTAAIPAVQYNAEVPLEFSEIDPVQNKEVDQAVRTAGFSETEVWTRMSTGSITALNLTAPGSGFTTPPTVAFTGGCATGATCGGAAASATLGYPVLSVAVTGGSGYTAAPTVSFVGGSGEGASATAALTPPPYTVVGLSVATGGTGYAVGDVLTLVGGTGTAATATVAAATGGVITSVTLTGSGSYSVAPTNPVTVTDATTTTASGATLTATTSATVASITVTNGGAYSTAPTVQLVGGGGTGAVATATLSTTSTLAVTLTSAGGGYTSAPTVTISGGGGTGATATASVGSGGCGTAHTCYPPAVNYTPFYYLINGHAFDKTNPNGSLFGATAGTNSAISGVTGTLLVRMVNAGLRMHVPSIVGSQTAGFTGAGVLTTATNPVGGFTLKAEDGNPLPDMAAPRVQTDVFMAAGKTFDVMVNVPATPTGATAPPSLPVYDRELSLSANSSVRDAGMLAYIGVNSAGLPVAAGSGVFAAALANPDTYNSVVACLSTATSCTALNVSDASKGVLANDVNVYGATLTSPPTHGALTCNAIPGSPVAGICANGTFTYTPSPGWAADTFGYCGNGAAAGTAGLCTTVALNASSLTGNPVANSITYTSPMAAFLKIPSPGVLSVDSDPNNLPLQVVVSSVSATGVTVNMDPNGGFTASLSGTATTATTVTFTYVAQNSQGRQSSAATVTIHFTAPSNLQVKVLDAQLYKNCNGDSNCISTLTPINDYRWIIEEDKTFWVDPNCTTNSSITTPGCPTVVGPSGTSTIPVFGVQFHTSNMDFVAQGCTGPLSCEGGQTMLSNGQHVLAVCDVGNGACRPDPTGGNGFTPVMPSSVHLDPTKRYYISVLPGDAANPFPANVGQPVCSTTGGTSATGACGHTMSGAPVPPACNLLVAGCTATSTTAFAPVNVLVLPTPLPTGRLSVIVFEDDFPLNGEQDGGGGNGTIPPIEPGLGGFNLVLWDTYGGLGDVTGQDTYDDFNQPLSNALAGTVDPVSGLDACPLTPSPLSGPQGAGPAPASGITGMIVTCPKYEGDGTTLSPLAGQAVIANLMPDKFSVQAYPGADRIARGEEWLQTNTLDGQHPHDSFIRIGEPSYFQEYGPAGYHVAIGFANPAIINARHNDVCAGAGTPGAVGPCSNTIDGQVNIQRLSRIPDERLYPSGSHDALAWTQCWVSLGDPDGEDFMFTKCDANGNFKFSNVPGGNWRLTVGDQWNDQIIDGLSTPANVGCVPQAPATTCTGGLSALHMGNLGIQQWQSNVYTKTFVDDNKNGIPDAGEIGIPLVYTQIRYRDGHTANNLVTDFNGVANFNETFPLFNWYTVEADSGRYKTTGIHTVYDAGGPADGSGYCGASTRPCGTSTAYNFMANTYEAVPLPADLSVPGAVYCAAADCTAEAAGFAAGTPKPSSSAASTGRIDPPWVTTEGWAGLTGQSNWIEFGKAPYAACPPACATVTSTAPGATTATTAQVGENGGIIGDVVYASTRPFDDASQMIVQPWEPHVPHVTINLYQEGFASDGVTPTLTMVDTTQTSSWDDWAQGFYPSSTAGSGAMKPYMSCPGQGTNVAGSPNQDLFFFTLFDQPNYLDYYNSIHSGGASPVHPLPYNSQFKCYDSMKINNQIQPAPYDGKYSFPSLLGINPTTGKRVTTVGCVGLAPGTPCPAASVPGVVTLANMPGTNCTICVANPDTTDVYRSGNPMLPPGKYVVEVIMPPGYEVYKEEDKNLLIGDNFIAPVTQQFGGLGTDIFIVPDQASVASMYDPTNGSVGYNPNNFQNQTTGLGLADELSGVPGFPGFQDPVWPCVGEMRVVPDYLSLFPQAKEVAPFAGATRPLCDRKEVILPSQASSNARFFIYTSTHIAAKFTGVITDDMTSEFDPFSPQFGEKFAPPNMPISTKDYLGNELSRVYSDHWGVYDGLTFSSWEVNPPNITGYSPTMQTQCMNDPGPVVDTRATIVNSAGATVPNPTYGQLITDPLYNPAYSDFCYEQPYMPGLTVYGDTPVVPTQAFAGAAYNNADCSYPDATPAIKEVDGDAIGPWVSAAGKTLTITALGDQQASNSAYSGPSASVAPFNLKTVTRHYGFGARCLSPTVGSTTCSTLSSVTIGGIAAVVSSWSDTQIVVTVPSGVSNCVIQQQTQYTGSTAQCGELTITAGNGKQSVDTVTVTIGGKAPTHVNSSDSIQAKIDLASPGDLLMIDPTCMTVATAGSPSTTATCSSAAIHAATPTQTASAGTHNEMLLMWKPVRLQGVGAVSSVLDANAFPSGKLLDPWRRHVNCLFGLTLQGAPKTATSGAGSYDPTGFYSCPDTSVPGDVWNFYNGAPSAPQIDRQPLEAILGWDATQNGNVAEQLQEPALMGAYEGAGITVLGKGVDYHGVTDIWTDGNEAGAFPTVTTLLSGVGPDPTALPVGDANPLCVDGTGGANRFPSNFTCNPSSIDGITVRNSSQGGGGIFVHGWAHHLQIANDRVYNNAGTLTGGVSVGQGEFSTPVILGSTTNAAPGSCSDGTGWIVNQHLPYCVQLQVNVHNNYIANNISLGDELFSGTLAGGGGVTFCTGNDYYRFNYNWVCGNSSSGEGGGLVHLGEIQFGDIEHNSFVLNQSDNPTIPTNGGGLQVMGTPDTDPICGLQPDSDCPPGLSDGTGHHLVINANLIQGNMAESGSGGGIRLQQVNGTDISTFPGVYAVTAADEGHTVIVSVPATATLPAVGNSVTIAGVSVAGYNGTFTVTRVGLHIFTYLDATTGLASGAGGTFTVAGAVGALGTAQAVTAAVEAAATTVTITTTPTLSPTVGDSVTLVGVTPTGYNGTFTVTSVPAGTGTFTYTDTTNLLAAGAGGTVTDANPNQAAANIWNGVSITNNMIVNNLAGWDGAGISLQDSLNVAIVNNTISSNDSLASSGVLTQSIGTPVASAPPGSCVNASGTTSCPQSAGVTSMQNSTLMTTSLTGLTVTCPPGQPSCTGFSNPLLANNVIWQNRSFEIGVGSLGAGNLNQQNLVSLFDASGAAAPVQTASGQCVTGVSYWDIGVRGDTGPGNHHSGFTLNPTYSVLDDTGYAASNLASNPNLVAQYCNGSRVPPECSVADGCGGPSGYGVPPGIADALTPNPIFTLTPAATVDEGNNWINVSWGPLALSNDAVAGGANGNYGGGTPFANYALTAGSPAIDYVPITAITFPSVAIPTLNTDLFGNPRPDPSNLNHFDVGAVEFQGTGGAQGGLVSIIPNTGAQGAVVNVTITGTGLTGATAVTVTGVGGGGGGSGITVSNFAAVSATTVTATFTIAANATLGARNVRVTVGGVAVGPVTFTVVSASATTLTSISPNSEFRGTSQAVVLTGTNFVTGATVVATPAVTGFTISGVTVVNSTTIDATFTSNGTTAIGNVNIDVVTAGGASNTLPFAINGPVLTSIAPASGNQGTAVAVTLTGTGLTGTTAINVSGGGIAVSALTVVSNTSVTATFTISAGATASARNVTVTAPGGTSNAVTFTVTGTAASGLTSIMPNTGARGTTQAVVLTGTGLTGATAVNVSGGGGGAPNGVTVTSFTVVNDTTIDATFTISATAALTARNVTVTTAGGTPTGPVTFTIVAPGTPVLSSISPASGLRGTPIAVTLTGTNFTTGATVNVVAPANGLTVTGVTFVNATTITATFNTTGTATIGPRSITVTTPGGTSGPATYTVLGPVLASISPNQAARGTTVAVSLFGSGLTGTTAIAVSGGGVTVSGIAVQNDTQVNATFTISATATGSARNVTVTAPGGTSNAVAFTVIASGAPTLTSIAPNTGVRGSGIATTPYYPAVSVTLTGTNFTGATGMAVSGTGITISGFTITSPQTATATFTISTTATLGARNVSITTGTGTSNTVPFTVLGPTLTGVAPATGARGSNALNLTFTGTNLTGATSLSGLGGGGGGGGITLVAGSVTVLDPCPTGGPATGCGTTVAAQINISATASTTAVRNIGVVTPIGTTNTEPFRVTVPPAPTLTSISPNSANHPATGSLAVPVTLTGTNFTATGTTIGGLGGGVSLATGSLTVVNAITITATFNVASTATLGARNITVTTPGGTTASVPFTVTQAALAISAPVPALNPTPANAGTETGTVTVTNSATGATAGAFTFTAAPTVTPAGTATSGFTITGGTCASGTVLSPATTTTAAGSCTITVQYASGGSTANTTGHVTVTGTGLAAASQNGATFTAN